MCGFLCSSELEMAGQVCDMMSLGRRVPIGSSVRDGDQCLL